VLSAPSLAQLRPRLPFLVRCSEPFFVNPHPLIKGPTSRYVREKKHHRPLLKSHICLVLLLAKRASGSWSVKEPFRRKTDSPVLVVLLIVAPTIIAPGVLYPARPETDGLDQIANLEHMLKTQLPRLAMNDYSSFSSWFAHRNRVENTTQCRVLRSSFVRPG